MDRRGFMKLLGLGASAAVAAKFGLLEMEEVNRVFSFPSQIRIATAKETAAITYQHLTDATMNYVVPRMVDQIYKTSPMFMRLRNKVCVELAAQVPISYVESVA